jgi:GGDEF domain-containing protein
MLWYVAIVGALNLCLGYYWAVRTRTCPRCARARAAEQRARPVPSPDEAAASSHSTAAHDEVSASAPAPNVEQPAGGSSVPSLDRDDPFSEFLTGLDAFRGELSDVDRQLGEPNDSADHVTECANRLRTAHDEYLGVTSAAMGKIETAPFDSLPIDSGKSALKQKLEGQVELVAASKSALELLDVSTDLVAARARLKKSTGDLNQSTDGLRAEVDDCLRAMWSEFEDLKKPPAKPSAPLDPATGLVTREHAESLLDELISADTNQAPATVALLELDGSASVDPRLLCGVSNIVRQSLAPGHTAARYSDQQFLLLVPQEDVNHVMRRAEEMRQRVASTEFIADGRAIKATVTCALAEVSKERSGAKLLEFLLEALGEAKRYGGNRTFMHDGNSPSPVVPPELMVAPQQLAI